MGGGRSRYGLGPENGLGGRLGGQYPLPGLLAMGLR